MAEIKKMVRFFTIADFYEEEVWLRNMHKEGWKFKKTVPPCFFYFEKCEPEDVIYRLDFKNNKEDAEYIQMLSDFGWEWAGKCLGWIYFRKPASKAVLENEGELFSDNQSRMDRVKQIIKIRLIPLSIVLLYGVIPNSILAFSKEPGWLFSFIWGALLALTVFLVVYCSIKLRKLKKNLEQQ